jgi:glycerol-3-phosphate cytidylyltransferase
VFRNDPSKFHLEGENVKFSDSGRFLVCVSKSLKIPVLDKLNPNFTLERSVEILEDPYEYCGGQIPNWWIGVGTALGMHREKGYIPGDTDIDIRIGLKYQGKEASAAAASEFIDRFTSADFTLVRVAYWDGLIMQAAFADELNAGIILDLYFFYEGISDGYFLHVIDVSMRKKPRHFIDNKTKVAWPTNASIKVNVPYPIEGYLEWRFGPEWNIPKKNSELGPADKSCLLPLPRVTVLTYGTFDLFHEGHLKLLDRAKALGDYLVVSVVSDELCKIKGKAPWQDEATRLAAIKKLPFVDEVYVQRMLDQKEWDIDRFGASYLVVGDDWKNHPRFESVRGYHGVEIVYLPRTPGVSTTMIKKSLIDGRVA